MPTTAPKVPPFSDPDAASEDVVREVDVDVRDIGGFSEIIFSGYDGLHNSGQNNVFSVLSFD